MGVGLQGKESERVETVSNTWGAEGWGKLRVSLLWIVSSVVTDTGNCTVQILPAVEMQRLGTPLFGGYPFCRRLGGAAAENWSLRNTALQ